MPNTDLVKRQALEGLEKVDFEDRLRRMMDQRMLSRRKLIRQARTFAKGFFFGGGAAMLGFSPLLLIDTATGFLLLKLAMAVGFVTGCWFGGTAGDWTDAGDLLDDARDFLQLNQAEADELRRRAEEFNRALTAAQEIGGFDGREEGVAGYFEDRRAALQRDVDSFFARLLEASPRGVGLPEPRRRRLEFDRDVRRLLELEASLAGFNDGGVFKPTRDITADVAAIEMRRALDEERRGLGLPEKALPPPPKVQRPKLLKPAKAG